MSTEELAVRMDAAFVKKEREHRFAAALWLLRRNPTLKRTLRAIRSHVARATAYGAPVDRAEIASALGVTLPVYEKRFSLIKAILGIRL